MQYSKGQKVRRAIHKNEWWLVVEDVVLSLIDSTDPKQYIQRMKSRDPELSKGWVQIVRTLPIDTTGGKQQMICANTEGIFRIIQSIPSPKAEPFKRWLARVGYDVLLSFPCKWESRDYLYRFPIGVGNDNMRKEEMLREMPEKILREKAEREFRQNKIIYPNHKAKNP